VLGAESPLSKREFTLAAEYRFNRVGTVRWILSHMMRYPIVPPAAPVTAILNNMRTAPHRTRLPDKLYVSLLGKSQIYHGRQRIGDIMACATNDVQALNVMFSPGLMLLLGSLMALVIPILRIGQLDLRLLLVPLILPCCSPLRWPTTTGV
jgi:hypothetical protein